MPSLRRAPVGTERQRDAERTQGALLDAALAEFAAKGLAGARVQDIADLAGVNKQLISYYFGGKQGLYDALVERWLEDERAMADPAIGLDDLVCRYLDTAAERPEIQQLFLRQNLEADPATVPHQPDADDLADLRRRQRAGEIDATLDPAYLLLVLQAAVSIGTTFPADVKRYLDLDAGSEEFRALARTQLRHLVRLLAGGGPAPEPD